ncbi:titin-like isoform X2 [Photinus pyralis]|uniref:titin-like isoform X2 n=1 Tax=Photinus pyralis TaxID=7054 RepID=UPI00126716F8|nr:titin-like isoform X2 [Photinus pyralis]
MSAETSGDVYHTNDEEVLRQMWQDTEDFGKKKEIRSHMYKLREERLRNFYNSTDSGTEIRTTQQASSIKEGNVPTHADSLLDQGFMSLKSKEIRDSESPTKDMHQFRVVETNRGDNQGWNVVSKNEVSQDGKTHTSMQIASTSSSEKIDKGVANYSAQCEQKSSVFQDGDDNNFTKSASTSSKSVLRQDAKGGDDNSSFQSSSTSTSSSSRVVSQHHATSDSKPRSDSQELVVRKTYTTDVPAELKRSPNYIDGNTTVTTETRTLADGTKVTTTRYETKGVSSKINQQNFHTSTTKTVNDSQSYQTRRNDTTNLDQRYVIRDGSDQRPRESPTGQRHSTDNRRVDEEVSTTRSVEDHVNKKVIHDKKDDVYLTKIINEKEYNPREQPAVNEVVRTSGNIESKTVTNSKITKVTHDDHRVTQKNQDVRYQVTNEPRSEPPRAGATPSGQHDYYITQTNQDVRYQVTSEPRSEPPRAEVPPSGQHDYYITQTNQDVRYQVTNEPRSEPPRAEVTPSGQHDHYVTEKNQEVKYQVTKEARSEPPRGKVTPSGQQPDDGIPSTPVHMTTMHTKNEIVETVKSDVGKSPQEPREPLLPSSNKQIPQGYLPNNRKPGDCKPTEERTPTNYRPPEQEIVPNQYSTPKPMSDSTVVQRTITTTTTTDKQPDKINTTIVVKPQTEKVTSVTSQTTYKTDYTAKRISVDISPTHDAFARSLRASPDRERKHGSVRSLKSSTSSLRSSTSPDKNYPYSRHPDTSSLDRKQPSRFSPTKNRPDSRESSPIKKIERPIPKKPSTDSRTSTITRRHNTDTKETRTTYDSGTITRQTKGRPRSRSVSPTTSASDIEFVRKVEVTDLDEHSPERRTPSHATSRPKSVPDGSITKSPTKKHPEKDQQPEKPLKRRDTYEERCRQILGINQENKTQKTPEDRKSPEKKSGHQIQEYPSQVRRTTEKKEFTEHKTVKKDSPGDYNRPVDVTRRTPEKGKGQPGRPGDRAPDYYGSETDETMVRNRVTTKTSYTPQKGKRPSDDETPRGRYPGSREITEETIIRGNTKPGETPKKVTKPQVGRTPEDYPRTETDERYTQETVTTDRVTKKSPAHPTDEYIPKGRPTEKYPGGTKITTDETVIRGHVITKPGDEPKKVTPTSQGKRPKGNRPVDQDFPSDGEETDERYTKETVTTNRTIKSSTCPTDDDLPEHRRPKERFPESTEVTTQETVIRGRDAPQGKQPKGYPRNEEETEDRYTEETVTRNRVTTKSSTRPAEDDLPDHRRPHGRLPGSTEITTNETVIRGRVITKPGDEPKKVTPVTQGKHPNASRPVDRTPDDYPSDNETTDRYTQETVTRVSTKSSTHPTDDDTSEDRKPRKKYPGDSEITTQDTVIRITKPGNEPQRKRPKDRQPGDTEDYPSHDEETEERYTQETTNRTTTKSSTHPTDHDTPKHRQPQGTEITTEDSVIRGTKPGGVPKKVTPIPQGKYPIGNRAPEDLPSDEEETEERYTQETVTRNRIITELDGDTPDHRKPKEHTPVKQPGGSAVTTKETVVRGHVTTTRGETPTKGTPVSQGKHPKGSRPVDQAPEDLPSDEEQTEECYTQETVTRNRMTTESSTRPTDDDKKPKDRSPLKHPGGSVVTTKETVIKGHVTTKPVETTKGKHPKGSRPVDRAPEDLPSDEEETEECYTQETVTRNHMTTESLTRPTNDDLPDHRKPKDRSPIKHPGGSAVTTTIIKGHVTTKPVETPTRGTSIPQGKHPKGSRPVDRAPEDLPSDEEQTEECYTQERVTRNRMTTESSTRPTDDDLPHHRKPKDRSPIKHPGGSVVTTKETVIRGHVTTKPVETPTRGTPVSQVKHPKGSRPVDRAPEDLPSDEEQTEECYTQESVTRNRMTTESSTRPTDDDIPDHRRPKDRSPIKHPGGSVVTTNETVIRGHVTTKRGETPTKGTPVSQGKHPKGSRPVDRAPEDLPSDEEVTADRYTHETVTTNRTTTKSSTRATDGPENRRPKDRSPEKLPGSSEIIRRETVTRGRVSTKPGDQPKKVTPMPHGKHPCDTETIDFYTRQTVAGKPKQRAPEDHPYETEETDERYTEETARVTTKSSETSKKHLPTPVGKAPTIDAEPKGKKPHGRSPDKYPSDTQRTVVRDHETTKPGKRPTERPKHGQPDREYPTDETSDCYAEEVVIRKRIPSDLEFTIEKHPTPKSTKPGRRLVADETTSCTSVTIQSKTRPQYEGEPQPQQPTDVSDSSDEEPLDQSPHITQETDDYYVSQTVGHTGSKPRKGSPVARNKHFEPEKYPSDTEETRQVYVTKDTIRRTSDQKVSTRQPNKRPIAEQPKPMPSSRVTKETRTGQTTTQKTTVTKKTTDDFVPKRRSPERDSYNRREIDERHSQQTTVQTRVSSKPDNKPKKPQPRSDSKPRTPSDTSSRVTQRYVAQATIDRTRVVSKPGGKPKYEEPRRPEDYPSDIDETKKPAGRRPEVSPYYHSEGTHYIATSRTVVTDERKPSRKSPDRKTVQESTPKKRVPKEEITRRSPGRRPVVEETIQTRDTYLTTDKATVHRRNKEEPAVKKPGGAKPTGNRQTPHEDHEDNYRRDDDFYTLNIKVYRNDLKTGRDKPTHKPVPSEPRERTKTDKTTVYRTEEKHFVNKTTRKPGKANSSDRDSPVTQIVRNQKPSKTRDVKPKPDATRHVVTTTIQVVPKKKTKEPAAKALPKGGSKPMPKDKPRDQVETDEEFVDENYIVDEHEESTDRTFDRQITRTITSPERVLKPKSSLPTSTRPTDTSKRPEKVITTKSIVISNDLEHGREVIVNLQRSKSSREATPDRSYAYPASDNEDKGVPRYPDEICEPDDPYRRRKPTKLSDLPVIETEDTGYLNKVDETDDCLLSVNEKVTKFVNEADKLRSNKSSGSVIDRLKVTQQIPGRPKSPKCQNYSEDEDERFTSVSEKVSHFIETAEKIKTHQSPQRPKATRPEFTVDENIKSDNCLLSVSDKVTKFNTSPNYKTPVSLSKMDAPRTTLTTECVQIDTEEDMYRRKPSVDEHGRKISEPSTPKSSRKNSETKTVISTTGRLRSTESIRKAKEIFENAAKDQTPVKPRRPILEDELKSTRLIIDKINRPHSTETDDTPGYMRPLNRSPRPHSPYRERSPSPRDRSRSPSVERHHKPHDPALDQIPHYMWPLDRSVHSPDRDTSRESSPSHTRPIERARSPLPSDSDVYEKRTTASLRKVDTEKATSKHRSFTNEEIEEILTVNEIEDIYEIEILEVLLEWAVSYEQRRRVRSQIRVVKQLIVDHKLPKVLYKKSPRSSSPKYKEVVVRKPSSTTHEEHTMHSYSERKRSTEIKTYSREVSPETKIIRKSPERKPLKPELKRVEPVSKKVVDEKPSWVTQRPLKKSSGDVPKTKPVSTTKKLDSRVSPPKERKPTDAITSSYGVGPTDENGSPLFGLKALRAQKQTGTTKVQGTVIKSHYYSENGHEPTGEISVTKYSNDQNDFEGEVDETEGLVSVTTTQRFGKGTPTKKAISDCEYYPEDDKIEEYENRKSSSTSVTRRGSVKQMSKKFIDNAVETSKTERQTSYPKAGLILRTSSFKKSSPDDREPSPGSAAVTTTVRKTTTTTSSGRRGDTFLNNQTRVRDVQDVITRMKNSDDDVQEGDTAEDVEARKLLNKFIGSQVILSGMETQTSSPPSSTVRRTTTTTTTTTKGGGKPTVVTRTFTHPITLEDLETIWDEPTLKLLLERSVDYEERRIIRGRLRDVMAEKEVCADPKSNQESSGRVEGESLLLPLLQGLLDAPDNEQTADSGTESGEDLRNGLLNEVQNVLAKLATSLKNSHDMSEERRSSLLQLVTRLQTGLSSQQLSAGERRSSGHGRFLKKRRHNRHTVGVSSEELEDARRLVEEMGLCRSKPTLEKQISEGHLSIPTANVNQNSPVVKNTTAKPYGSPGSLSPSGTSSTIHTPTEVTGVLQLSNPLTSLKIAEPRTSEFVSSNFLPEIQKKTTTLESETDDDLVALKKQTLLQNNPIYARPDYQDDDKQNRFNNKKLKIKRANTIDIPKPVNIYESDDDYDSDTSLVDKQCSRRNHYLALRGPIRVGRNQVGNTSLPIFEPKTESDKKFMAFINKHNEKNDQGSSWGPQCQGAGQRGNNWNNRFGNIRTAFEKASINASVTPTIGVNSARNFWKTADSAVAYRNEPKINRHIHRRSENFQERKVPWATPTINENEVVTGSLKVETKGLDANKNYKFVPQPLPVNKFSHAPTSAFAAIPKKVTPEANHFVKSDYQSTDPELDTPLFLYSPKPIPNASTPSPSSAPWVNTNGVQKLAATKFEQRTSADLHEPPVRKPKKATKEFTYSGEKDAQLERVSAPYINKCADTSNTVRKISDQFNKSPAPSTTKPEWNSPKYRSYPPSQLQGDYAHHFPNTSYQTNKSVPQYEEKPTPIYQQQYQNHPTRVIAPVKEDRHVPEGYTSSTFVKFNPAPTKYESNPAPPPVFPSAQYTRQTSQESLKEYEAAVAKVMKGPVAQQAVTVQQKSPKGRNQHDMEVALNLKNALQKVAEKSPDRKFSVDSAIISQPKPARVERKTQSFKKTSQPSFSVNGRSLSMESTEINENGESVITSKFHIPVTIPSPISKSPSQQMFSKADMWNQLMYDQQQTQRKPISAPSAKSVLRSKSSHTLAVPTVQFQAGMTRDEVVQKKRSVEAYFSGSVSPQSMTDDGPNDKAEVKVNKSSINRKKTSEKVSAHKQMGVGVSRSQTLPNIVCPDMLDESKVEESFEDLFKSHA